MAEGNTQYPGAASGDEPTRPLASNPDWSTEAVPTSPWARSPQSEQAWNGDASTSFRGGSNDSTKPIPASMDSTAQPQPQPTQQFPSQPSVPSAGTPANAAPTYPGTVGQPAGWSYAGAPQDTQSAGGGSGYLPPGYYQLQGYPPPPVEAPPKRRWPVVLVALALAFLLGVAGFELGSGDLGALTDPQTSAQPSISQPSAAEPSSGSTSTSAGATSSKVTAAQSKGVVLITATTSDGEAAGTGMILSSTGLVVTNYHVVAGSTELSVKVVDSKNTYVATVLGFDQTQDVAVLQLKDASGLDTVTTNTDQLSVSTKVSAVGNAEGGGKLVRANGSITDLDQSLTVSSDSPWGSTENLSGLIATNAGAVPGDSGGPMFNANAQVIGMTTAGSTKDSTSYAIPIATALAVVDQVKAGQDAGTVRVGPAGYLGVRVASTSSNSSSSRVTEVVSGSPAAKAGITAGSHITKVGATTITDSTNVASVIRAVEPGTKVKISWTTTSGKAKSATVTMGSSPVN
jgi:S1-C subfamily serine protease